MPANYPRAQTVPERTPAARVGTLLVGLGAKEIKWKCQKRACPKLISRDQFACPPHLAELREEQREAMAAILRNYPIGHRMVTMAVRALDATWEELRHA